MMDCDIFTRLSRSLLGVVVTTTKISHQTKCAARVEVVNQLQ